MEIFCRERCDEGSGALFGVGGFDFEDVFSFFEEFCDVLGDRALPCLCFSVGAGDGLTVEGCGELVVGSDDEGCLIGDLIERELFDESVGGGFGEA